VSAELRDRQLLRLCDVLDAVEPDAATLCAGWTAHDLAIHVWILQHDPLGWPGVLVPALGRPRAERIRRRRSYGELVDRLRSGRGTIACMPLDRWEGHRHALGEFWIHTQDVARPNGIVQPAADPALQEALWRRVQRAARRLHRHRSPGLVLERPDGRRFAVTEQPARCIVTGEPTELMCWVYGREAVADVTVTRSR
jgi:uncharacterized protein (TIGR03085 family)